MTQTDRALALRRRFNEAKIPALNERLRILREAQRSAEPARKQQAQRRCLCVRFKPLFGLTAYALTYAASA